MEMIERFGLPVALAVALFVIMAKWVMADKKASLDLQQKYIDHLEKTSAEQTNVIAENTKAMNQMQEVLKELLKNYNITPK